MRATAAAVVTALLVMLSATATEAGAQRDVPTDPERFRLGVTVLLDDQLSLVRGRRMGVVVESASRNERGDRVEDLLRSDSRVRTARASVQSVWRVDAVPAAGIAGDPALLTRLTAACDSALAGAQVIVVDIVDLGTRHARASGIVLAALTVAARRGVAIVVLDRPNPLTGEHAEGPAPDSVAAASDGVYGLPARHGMTIGEVARWFNEAGHIGAVLTVVPVRGWRRSAPPPSRGSVAGRYGVAPAGQLLLLGAFAPLAATNLSVAAGASKNEVRIGAPWLNAAVVADALKDRIMPGFEFSSGRDRFGDGSQFPSLRISVVDTDRGSGLRVLAAVLSQVQKAHPAELSITASIFDALTGSPAFRRGIAAGDDSDAVVDRELIAVVDFRRRVRPLLLYR